MTYQVDDISPDMSFLEMLDVLNQQLILKEEEPVAFDHDCREGICGTCSLYINGRAHGPQEETGAVSSIKPTASSASEAEPGYKNIFFIPILLKKREGSGVRSWASTNFQASRP